MDRDSNRVLRLRRGPGGDRTRLSRSTVALGFVVAWIGYHLVTDAVFPHRRSPSVAAHYIVWYALPFALLPALIVFRVVRRRGFAIALSVLLAPVGFILGAMTVGQVSRFANPREARIRGASFQPVVSRLEECRRAEQRYPASPEECLRGVSPDPLGGHQATSIRYASDGARFVLQVPCTSYTRRTTTFASYSSSDLQWRWNEVADRVWNATPLGWCWHSAGNWTCRAAP
jgi:hypothetical protein